jgi:probable F420-dependent oxidoreductase
MHVGVSFPHHAIGSDPTALCDWAQACEDLGFDQVIVYEHVLGPDAALHPDQNFRYTNRSVWHEPLVLCGFLAAVTKRIGLQTGVVVLPLRETVIAAKQAAEVDVLSGGRLRFGVGVGWMEFEFDGLGHDFHARGARLDEQMELLRRLWTEPSVTYQGRWHRIDGAGINPLPVQRPVPVWVGGRARAVARRIARHGDGWIVPGDYLVGQPDDEARRTLDWLHQEAVAVGRLPEEFGVQGVMSIAREPEAKWATRAEEWRRFGATDLLVDTGVSGRTRNPAFETVTQQINALERLRRALGSVSRAAC